MHRSEVFDELTLTIPSASKRSFVQTLRYLRRLMVSVCSSSLSSLFLRIAREKRNKTFGPSSRKQSQMRNSVLEKISIITITLSSLLLLLLLPYLLLLLPPPSPSPPPTTITIPAATRLLGLLIQIYMSPLIVHTNQKRFQSKRLNLTSLLKTCPFTKA